MRREILSNLSGKFYSVKLSFVTSLLSLKTDYSTQCRQTYVYDIVHRFGIKNLRFIDNLLPKSWEIRRFL